jgi:diguanylate cyclase (GGDEF)-like protein
MTDLSKHLEQKLELLRHQDLSSVDRLDLIDELAQAYQELQHLNRSLAEANQQKSQLLEELRAKSAELEQQTKEDSLTGLSNRRYLDLRLENEFARAKRYRRNLTVIMADIDHFKRINDSFSHQTGDQVLKKVAGIFAENCRGVDIIARYGGEEFVLVLPETPSSGGILVCERIRKTIEEYRWEEIHKDLKVTISLGLCYDVGLASHREMLAAADAKMYQAKDQGRNQVKF